MKEKWDGGHFKARIENMREVLNDESPQRGPSRREFLATTAVNGTSLVLATHLALAEAGRIAQQNDAHAPHPGMHMEYPSETELLSEALPENPEWWKEAIHDTPPSLIGKSVDPANFLWWGYLAPDPALNHRREEKVVRLANGQMRTEEVNELIADPRALPARLPPIPFHTNLQKMMEVKKKKFHGKWGGTEHEAFFTKLGDAYADRFEHEKLRTMNLAEFRTLIEGEVMTMLHALEPHYATIATAYFENQLGTHHLKAEEKKKYISALGNYLRSLAQRITPNIMLAFITTELMPSQAGVEVLDFLLQNAGVEFIERIPALYDDQLSYGPAQLTPDALKSITQILHIMRRGDLVPNSLSNFSRIEDHLRAGFLLAFQNVITLTQDLVREGKFNELMPVVESATGPAPEVFLQYLSAAHHRPSTARDAMHTWLKHNASLAPAHRSQTLLTSFGDSEHGEDLRVYAKNAQIHFAALTRAPATV